MINIPLMRPLIKKDLILDEISKVLDSGWLSGGPTISRFENALKEYNNDVDGEYVSVSNATVGLEMSLLSLNYKQGERFKWYDEVIVPSWSWIATATAVSNTGANPIWCDVNEFGVMTAELIEPLINEYTVAIIVVHQMGIPCDMDEINELARRHNIKIIEDAACAFGSEYKNRKIGNSENIVVFSHQAKKCVTTAGEGGTIVTKDKKLADWFRSYRVFGTNNTPLQREQHAGVLFDSFNMIGTNNKISDIQCAYGLAHLSYIDEEIELRAKVAERYEAGFSLVGGIYIASKIPEYCTRNNWQSHHVLLDETIDRNIFISKLKEYGISAKRDIQAISEEPVYIGVGNWNSKLKNTLMFHEHGLQLPFYAELSESDQLYVIETVKEILYEFK